MSEFSKLLKSYLYKVLKQFVSIKYFFSSTEKQSKNVTYSSTDTNNHIYVYINPDFFPPSIIMNVFCLFVILRAQLYFQILC